jgi:hypothetical protein
MDNSLYELDTYSSGLEYATTSSIDTAQAAAIGIIAFIIGAVVALFMYIIGAIFLGKVFKKAGVPAWQAWVPILNSWKMFELGGKPGFWAVLAIVPVLNIVSAIFGIIAMHNINLKLRYDAGMTVLAVLVPLVWLIVVGTSKHAWDDSLGAPRVDKPDFQPASGAPAPVAPAPVGPAPTPYAAPTPAAYAAPAPTEAQPPITPDVQPQPSAPADEQPQPPVSQQ